MYIILSQRIDIKSDYDDYIFHLYHFPSRYRSQIKCGDKFIYNQGDRTDREHRFYFGCGEIGEIYSDGQDGFYAKVINPYRFEKKVGIHYEKAKFYESMDYESVRKKPKPPWQSAIRKLSEKAYERIIREAGQLIKIDQKKATSESFDSKKRDECLYEMIIDYTNNHNETTLLEIIDICVQLLKKKE